MDIVFLVGRALYVLIFVLSGVMAHLIGYKQGVAYARTYRVPLAQLGVPLTGVVAIVGGVFVAFGLWGDLGALLLGGFLLSVTPLMHAFWLETDPAQRQSQMTNFMKNVSMAGGALALFYLFNQLQGDVGLTLTDPLFGRW